MLMADAISIVGLILAVLDLLVAKLETALKLLDCNPGRNSRGSCGMAALWVVVR